MIVPDKKKLSNIDIIRRESANYRKESVNDLNFRKESLGEMNYDLASVSMRSDRNEDTTRPMRGITEREQGLRVINEIEDDMESVVASSKIKFDNQDEIISDNY